MMPYMATAANMEAPVNAKMAAGAVPASGTHSPAATYPLVNVHEPARGRASEPTHPTSPHHSSSPLRRTRQEAARQGCCFHSYNSTNSLYGQGPMTGNSACASPGGLCQSYLASFQSTELQEHLSMASPATDFYYHSPQAFYLESPMMPPAAAELYGGGASPYTSSFVPVMAMPPMMGPYCYPSDPNTVPVAAATVNVPASPSRMGSSMSASGSRHPQWYLPRGMYGAATTTHTATVTVGAAAGAAVPCLHTTATPSATPLAARSPAEHTLPSSESAKPRVTSTLHSPPLGTYPVSPSLAAVSSAEGESRPQRTSLAQSGVAFPVSYPSSPALRPSRPPSFVSYDGRAYGLPPTTAITASEATAALAHSPLVSPRPLERHCHQCRQSGAAEAQECQTKLRCSGSGSLEKPHHRPLPSGANCTSAFTEEHQKSSAAADDAETVEVTAAPYSPREKALLLNAHTRLALARAKSSQKKPQSQKVSTTEMDNSVRPGSTSGSVRLSAEEQEGIPAATAATDATLQAPEEEAAGHHGGASSQHSTGQDTNLPVSPIHRLSDSDGADTAPLDDSMLDELDLSSRHRGSAKGEEKDAETDVHTRAVLEEVLTVRGVKWRHDPYSRRMLAGPSDCCEEADAERQDAAQLTASSSESVTAGSPHAEAARGKPANLTQPPRSADSSFHTAGSNSSDLSGCSDGKPKLRPSARRMPIKKICVRHYVDSKGDVSDTAECSVGMLSTVVPSPLLSCPPPPSRSAGAAPLSSTNTSVHTTAHGSTSGSLNTSVLQESSTACPAAMPHSTVSPQRVRNGEMPSVRPQVPQPRSKQQQRQQQHPCHQMPSAAPPATSFVDPASWSMNAAAHGGHVVVAAAESHGAGLSAHGSALQGSLPAWMACADRDLSRPCSAVVAAPATALVSSAEDIDTSYLERLWHQLDSSGCFRDALEARLQVLGAESNSSTRVLQRSVVRRWGYNGSGDAESAGRLQQVMVSEKEVTHVYVLRHRLRRSCAVATQLYDCGTQVVVDGDMGVDTGVVIKVITKAEYLAMSVRERRDAQFVAQLELALPFHIYRAARADELVLKATAQTPLEDATLRFVRYLTTQPHLFQSCRVECMEFVDAEFQADGQKLYVYYQTVSPVRFLELATYLNHIFHCRIWMKLAKHA